MRILKHLSLLCLLFALPAWAVGNNGTVTGSPTYAAGKFSNAITTLSTSNYVTLPAASFPGGTTWTIDLWLKTPASSTTTAVAVSIDPSGTAPIYFGMASTGKFVVSVSGSGAFSGGAQISGSASINDGNWHHCALEMSGGTTLTLWTDGALAGTATGTYTAPTNTASTIGYLAFAGAYPWNGSVDELAFSNYAKYSGSTYTVPTAAYTGSETGLTSLYHLDSGVTDASVAPSVTFAPNAAGLVYSPANWNVTSSQALTINSGAYLSFGYSGTTAPTLNFNVANLGSPASEIYIRIDAYEAQTPWTVYPVAATVTPPLPSNTSQYPYHFVEVLVKSTSQNINRWTSPSATAVILTGITLPSGAALVAPPLAPNGKVVIFADSVGEGVRTVNQTATNDTDQNDVLQCWSYQLRQRLGVEVGLVGFGSTGYTVAGSGNVPALTGSYNLIMAGIARPVDATVNLVLIEDGGNDTSTAAATVQSAATTVINGLLTQYPNAIIAIFGPFNQAFASTLKAAALASTNPNRTRYIDTTGIVTLAYGMDSLSLHPTGANNMLTLAPNAAKLVAPYLAVPAYSFF